MNSNRNVSPKKLNFEEVEPKSVQKSSKELESEGSIWNKEAYYLTFIGIVLLMISCIAVFN